MIANVLISWINRRTLQRESARFCRKAMTKGLVVGVVREAKRLVRGVKVSWREDPTRHDIEAVHTNIERVGLVIKTRWYLVAALCAYSILGTWAYTLTTPLESLAGNLVVPAAAMVFVVAYNIFYQATYRKLGNIAVLNHAQLMFDAVVVTVLVYYSGGAHSWFWAMYLLLILEAALILPKRWHTWAVAFFALALNGLVVWGVFFGVLADIAVPFVEGELHRNFTFVSVTYLWQVTVLMGAAGVSSMMINALREREGVLARHVIADVKTGLYNRTHFNRVLANEISRAEHIDRDVALIFIDIDDFNAFNRDFGLEAGDTMLSAIAEKIRQVVRECEEGCPSETNIVARYGGEEFAVLLVQDRVCGAPTPEYSLEVGQALQAAIGTIELAGAGVSASIGIAHTAEAGHSSEAMLTSADSALQAAFTAGGNVVRASWKDPA